ncbi:MAG: hypothetical protein WKF88_03205 [Ferruginibacter sp.]
MAVLLFAADTQAQYYYKDIVSNKQLLADMKVYRENKVKAITLKSFDDDGSESVGFFFEKKFSRDFRKTEMFTRADIAPASESSSAFDADGKLLSTYDSSAISVTEIKYRYDDKNRIGSILSVVRSRDEDFHNVISEEHIYTYNETDTPLRMSLVKNGRDTTVILFGKDEKGNIAIEKDTKNASKYYYYYDGKKRLTDIVHENESSRRLKPDYIFEYNSAGLVSQMTAVQEGTNNYFIWKYTYDNGMRIKERVYSNERRLMGSIEYEYK